VKAVLVSQLGVEAARLTTQGFGSAKPIASNDTPLGRADNRRVEFVKQ
jgi:OmpA-OmpF porin, OOP family